MANSKELTEQVMELHKKQTEEMKALEEQPVRKKEFF